MVEASPSDREGMRYLLPRIRQWGAELGFQFVGTSPVELGDHPARLAAWLAEEFHGEMDYMARNEALRADPTQLIPGTCTIISARMNYLPSRTSPLAVLNTPTQGYVSRYALGRDYHKLVRRRLVRLVERLRQELTGFQFQTRPFCDSAPVLEKGVGQQAGAGWIGKNTLLIHPEVGSWFFLGEIYTDLPLPVEVESEPNRCGSCHACLDSCPTGAFPGPYQLDARRCISYLTIEHRGTIPIELRSLMGNRIFGCDDCQLVCPWNRHEEATAESDFTPRHHLDAPELCHLFAWSEEEFLERSTGSAIRRTGYLGWIRNLAIALGNAPGAPEILQLLERRLTEFPEWVAEHIGWAMAEQRRKLAEGRA